MGSGLSRGPWRLEPALLRQAQKLRIRGGVPGPFPVPGKVGARIHSLGHTRDASEARKALNIWSLAPRESRAGGEVPTASSSVPIPGIGPIPAGRWPAPTLLGPAPGCHLSARFHPTYVSPSPAPYFILNIHLEVGVSSLLQCFPDCLHRALSQ